MSSLLSKREQWKIVNKTAFDTYRLIFQEYKQLVEIFFDGTISKQFILEGLKVVPDHRFLTTMLALARACQFITKSCPEIQLTDYVSFLRVPLFPLMKLSCDWCSICNGYIAYLRECVAVYIKKLQQEQGPKSSRHLTWLTAAFIAMRPGHSREYSAAFLEHNSVTAEELFPELTSERSKNIVCNTFVQLFTQMFNYCQSFEATWCPFKHMKRLAEEPTPKRQLHFLDGSEWKNIKLAGAIVGREHKVTCENCVKIINEHENEFDNTDPIHAKETHRPVDYAPYLRVMNQIARGSA